MSQPLDRNSSLPELGAVDREAGEFWVENPFRMPRLGHNLSAYERNRVFLNRGSHDRGSKKFLDASFASQADLDSDSRSVVAADFDRDGRVDLLVGSSGGGPLRLLRNTVATANHSIHVSLVGRQSNRPAIGSRLEFQCGDRRLVRDLFAPNGCLGQGPAELTVGVGAAATIDRLTVRWPSGGTDEYRDLPVDCRITIQEGDPTVTTSGLRPAE